MDWDWQTFGRRRPAGVSSLPDDSVGSTLDGESCDGGDAESTPKPKRQRKARPSAGSARGAAATPLRNLAEGADPDGEGGSGGSSAAGQAGATGASTQAASNTGQDDPVVVAQASALKKAAVSGNPFCEE